MTMKRTHIAERGRETYAVPELETAEVRAERGFAASDDSPVYDWDGTEKTGFDDESSYF